MAGRRAHILAAPGATAPRTVQLWRLAARERLGVPADTTTAAHDASGAGRVTHKMRGVDLVVDNATLRFPHDESPMRVVVLAETWAKGIEQVRGA